MAPIRSIAAQESAIAKDRRETAEAKLRSLGERLTRAWNESIKCEKTAVERAVETGRIWHEVREYLKNHAETIAVSPRACLLGHTEILHDNKGGLKQDQRRLDEYRKVYLLFDSGVRYQSIELYLREWQKRHGSKKRFTPVKCAPEIRPLDLVDRRCN